jgi:phenylalanyl-tRNA synthetase beta chain
LLAEFGKASEVGAVDVDQRKPAITIAMDVQFPSKYVGCVYSEEEVISALKTVGCAVEGTTSLKVTPPSWRVDLAHAADLVEEVARIYGYERIPSTLPSANPGFGLTHSQRLRREIARLLAASGVVEVLSYPFMGDAEFDAMRIDANDARRRTVKLANPISLQSPSMRSTLLGPLLNTAKRNAGRGHKNVAIYEIGAVVLPDGEAASSIFPTDKRPTDDQLHELNNQVPVQPWYVAGVLVGNVERGQKFSDPVQPWDWQNTIALVTNIVASANLEAEVVPALNDPWHPGRCAAIAVNGAVIGFAGELHPRVAEEFGIAVRSCAFEIDLDALAALAVPVVIANPVKTFPKATQDVALIVGKDVSVEALRSAVLRAAGDLVESAVVFDIFEGEQIGLDKKSVAISLTFRAPDRTLTDAEVLAAREAAIAAAHAEFGAIQRS